MSAAGTRERGETVDAGHLAIQEHDIEGLLFRKLDRDRSILCLLGSSLNRLAWSTLRTTERTVDESSTINTRLGSRAWMHRSIRSRVSCTSSGLASVLSTSRPSVRTSRVLIGAAPISTASGRLGAARTASSSACRLGLTSGGIEKHHVVVLCAPAFRSSPWDRRGLRAPTPRWESSLRRGLADEFALRRCLGHDQNFERKNLRSSIRRAMQRMHSGRPVPWPNLSATPCVPAPSGNRTGTGVIRPGK